MKKDDITTLCTPDFIQEIKRIVTNARQKAYAAINSAMVEAYWQMGKRIVEQEQQGRGRADYGSQLLKSLSKELTAEFGKGFSVNSLYYFRQFYLAFPEKLPTAWGILTWSHYKRLLSVSNSDAVHGYLKEAAEQMWSYRTLDRNIGSQYYERLLLSQHKDTVEGEVKALTAPFDKDRMEFIKNPTVAEFIGLSPNSDFTETELEGAIIGNLQKFLHSNWVKASRSSRRAEISPHREKRLFHRPRVLQLHPQIVCADRPQNDDHHAPRRRTDGYVRSDVRRAGAQRGR